MDWLDTLFVEDLDNADSMGWSSALYASGLDNADTVVWLGTSCISDLSNADGVDWLGANSVDWSSILFVRGFNDANGIGWFGTSYKIRQFSIDITISCKIVIITCTWTLRLLVLRLHTRLNSLYRSSMDTIYVAAFANFCFSTIKNINSSIP